jgi:hypothetical protein
MAKNLMIDIETLSTEPNACILSIGAVYFDKNGPVEDELGDIEQFYAVIDLQSCIDAGLHISASTLEWWFKQSQKARSAAFDATHSLSDALYEFSKFIEPGTKVWGNGADFDLVILKSAYSKLGLALPWKFYDVMCFRTLKSLFPGRKKPESEGTAHNALDDAIWQAKYYSNIVNKIKE